MNELSRIRLALMRALYAANLVLLGLDVWPELVGHDGPWDPMRGVAFSFWGALSALSAFGIRYPVKLLPLLLLQFLYKSIWLVAVALPNWSAVRSTGLADAMLIGFCLDVIAIPWPHVARQFALARGDRWWGSPRSRAD